MKFQTIQIHRVSESDADQGIWLLTLNRPEAMNGLDVATALGERPELAARLLAVMQNWSPELVRSRGGRHGWYGEVTGWLRTLGTDLPTDRRA